MRKCDYCTLPSLPYLNLKKLFSVLPSLEKILPDFEINHTKQLDYIKEAMLKDYRVLIDFSTIQKLVEVSLKKQIFIVLTKDSFLLIFDANSNQIRYSLNLKTRIPNYTESDLINICIGSCLDIILCMLNQKYLLIWEYKLDKIHKVDLEKSLKISNYLSIYLLNYDKNLLVEYKFKCLKIFDTFTGKYLHKFKLSRIFCIDFINHEIFLLFINKEILSHEKSVFTFFKELDNKIGHKNTFSLFSFSLNDYIIHHHFEDNIGWPLTLKAYQDQSLILIPHTNNKILLINAIDKTITKIIESNSGLTQNVFLCNDGIHIIFIDKNYTINLLNIESDAIRPIITLSFCKTRLNYIVYSSNTIGICDKYDGITFIDLETEKKQNLQGHRFTINAFDAKSPQMIVTGGHDQKIILWNASENSSIEKVEAHDMCVTSLGFTDDCKVLISGGMDAKVKMWNICNFELFYVIDDFDLRINQICVFEEFIVCTSESLFLMFSIQNIDNRKKIYVQSGNELLRCLSKCKKFLVCKETEMKVIVYKVD